MYARRELRLQSGTVPDSCHRFRESGRDSNRLAGPSHQNRRLAARSLVRVPYRVCGSARAEPAPVRTLLAKAKVRSVIKVETVIGGSTSAWHYSPSVKLDHPFQLVQLEFIPARASGPVVALNSVDLNSISGLAPSQMVDIDYDADNPRIARIQGGTRHFPAQALRQLMTTYGAAVVLLGALFLSGRLRSRRLRAREVPGD